MTDYYSRQTEIINSIAPGATVIISPYLEARAERQVVSPEEAAAGYEKFLGLANGTYLYVSPQDGLGTDTTALSTDESAEHLYTTEEYFEQLQAVNAEQLLVTVEAMTPGDGDSDTRGQTTRERVEEQLDATAPYVQGAIAYQWSGPTAITEIPAIGSGTCAAGPGLLVTNGAESS